MSQADANARDVFRLRGYLPFWAAETVSGFGSYVTTLALQVLVVTTLSGTAADVGFLNASRWLPYLLFGLVVGVFVDRRRRKPILVFTDLACAVLLGLIPLFWLWGVLTLPILLGFVAGFGCFSLLNDAASMSFLPRLVPRPTLLAANARLDQSSAVAQTSGPLVAGGLVALLGAPLAVLIDAASYLFSAASISRIRISEPSMPADAPRASLKRELGEGLRWVYRHRTLAPLAITGHGWFLFNSMLITVFVPFMLLRLQLNVFELGITLAAAGVTGLLGSLFATRLGMRLGVGRVVIASQALMPIAWAVIALVPTTSAVHGHAIVVVVACIGQGLYGLALGLSNANEMGYRQAITPDALQGRVNITIRSINRAMIVIGAPLGGLLADSIGYRQTLWSAIAGFVVVTIILAASPFRHARHGDV